jgi:hypothetical protein
MLTTTATPSCNSGSDMTPIWCLDQMGRSSGCVALRAQDYSLKLRLSRRRSMFLWVTTMWTRCSRVPRFRASGCVFYLRERQYLKRSSPTLSSTTSRRLSALRRMTWSPNCSRSACRCAVFQSMLLTNSLSTSSQVRTLIRIVYRHGTARHWVFLLHDGMAVCDCGASLHLGLPCRHVGAAVWSGLPFCIGWLNERCASVSLATSGILTVESNSWLHKPTKARLAMASITSFNPSYVPVLEEHRPSRSFGGPPGISHAEERLDWERLSTSTLLPYTRYGRAQEAVQPVIAFLQDNIDMAAFEEEMHGVRCDYLQAFCSRCGLICWQAAHGLSARSSCYSPRSPSPTDAGWSPV